MQIIELHAENFKRLSAVSIKPDSDANTVVISGKNAQGKTSVLDAIWAALGGKDAAKGTTKPIREGAKSAQVTLDLGELKVVRRWTASKTTLTVTLANGSAVSSPQGVLDKLIGKLTFDPLAFANADAKTQLKQLLSVVELPFDPAELEAERKDVYESRTLTGREVTRMRGHLGSLPEPDPTTPPELISVSDLMVELQEGEALERKRAEMREEFYAVRDRIQALKAELLAAEERYKELLIAGQQLPKEVDLSAIRFMLANADEHNAKVRQREEYSRAVDALEGVEEEYAQQTGRLKAIDGAKQKGIANAAMPVEGLSFDDDGVLFNGVPFAQASAAERLRVSTAMAMALNPEVRVIRILDGSLLDSDNLAIIDDLAKEKDFQVWIEKVDESGEVGIVIEDGKVKQHG